jgi:hypothetical protein
VLAVDEHREREFAGLADVLVDIVAKAARSYGQHLCVASDELVVVLTQLRKVLTAMWSEEPAQEHEHHGSTAMVGKSGQPARRVGKGEVRSGGPDRHGRTVDEHFAIVSASPCSNGAT